MINKISLLIVISALMQSCAPLLFVGAGAATSATTIQLAKNRSTGIMVDDILVLNKIKVSLLKRKLFGIHVNVVDAKVMYTGNAKSENDIIDALKIAWSHQGVVDVINEIKLENKNNKNSIKQDSVDVWITTQIKTKIFFSKVKFVNYTILTINNIVYIFGVSNNEKEVKQVENIAARIRGVKKVISYVYIKPSLQDRQLSVTREQCEK